MPARCELCRQQGKEQATSQILQISLCPPMSSGPLEASNSKRSVGTPNEATNNLTEEVPPVVSARCGSATTGTEHQSSLTPPLSSSSLPALDSSSDESDASKTEDLQSSDACKSDQVFESLVLNSGVSEYYKGSYNHYNQFDNLKKTGYV